MASADGAETHLRPSSWLVEKWGALWRAPPLLACCPGFPVGLASTRPSSNAHVCATRLRQRHLRPKGALHHPGSRRAREATHGHPTHPTTGLTNPWKLRNPKSRAQLNCRLCCCCGVRLVSQRNSCRLISKAHLRSLAEGTSQPGARCNAPSCQIPDIDLGRSPRP